jgi:nucleotide-binding universal stress UspA family protein
MRILVAYDGSPGSKIALDLMANLAWGDDAEFRAVSVAEPMVMAAAPALTPASLVPSPQLMDEIDAWHRGNVDAAVAALRGAGLNAEGEVLRGRAGTVIVDEIKRWGADLVVGGSRGHGKVASLLLGSVSAEVIDNAACPVLVTRRDRVRRVVLATDGSAPSAAAEETLSWPVFADAEIKVVSVADVAEPWRTGIAPTMYPLVLKTYQEDLASAKAKHQRLADDAVERLEGRGRPATPEVRSGDAAAEILNAAEAWNADLVVMGSRGETGLRRMLLGSVARNVVHGAQSSVLVAHAPGDRDGSDSSRS